MDKKRIIIFGAGDVGVHVLNQMGKDTVLCFVDNFKHGSIDGVPIIKFDDIFNYYPKGKVIVASNDYFVEMSKQLEKVGITDYLIWKSYFDRFFNKFASRKIINEKDIRTQGCVLLNGEPFIMPLCEQIYKIIDSEKKRIAIYTYDGLEDIFLFLFYVYDAIDKVVSVIRTKFGCYFQAPDIIKKLSFYNGEIQKIEYEKLKAAEKDIDALVLAVGRQDIDICPIEELFADTFETYDLFDVTQYVPSNSEVCKLKNKYQGQRCFVVANGPSLKKEDLDILKIHNEICFGMNKIFLMFDKTEWRPEFLAVADKRTIMYNKEKLLELDIPFKFFANFPECELTKDDGICLNHVWENTYPNTPRFSIQPDRVVFGAGTTVYDICIQMAVYMGFKEIYLLGVDNTMNTNFRKPNHFDKNYIKADEAAYIESHGVKIFQNIIDSGFEEVERESRIKGYRVFNATRGGKLETFERVDFDTLFE